MSKFFAMEDSSTESESDSSHDSEDFGGRFDKARKGGNVHSDSDESESEDEEKRIVRSQKEKKFGELTALVKNMKNHKKIADVVNVLSDFEELVKKFEKSKKVIEAEGVPKFYIRCLAELEDFVNEIWEDREGRKKMSKIAAKSLTSLRQKVRKYIKDFETDISAFRENPDEFEDEEEAPAPAEVADGGAADTAAAGKSAKASKKADDGDESSESDSDDWDSDSDSDSSSSSSDDDYGGNLAAKFLKKPGKEEERARKKKAKQEEKDKRKKEEAQRREERRQQEEKEWETVESRSQAKAKVRLFEKGQEITFSAAVKKLEEIRKGRGKRATDRSEQVGTLSELEKIVIESGFGAGLRLKVLFDLLSAIFDYNPSVAVSMRSELWVQLLENMDKLFDLLNEHKDELTVGSGIAEEEESLENPPYVLAECPLTQMERADSEYTKILQNSDAHSTVYVERLQDERKVCGLVDRLVEYLESTKAPDHEKSRAYSLKIQHLYYRFDQEWAKRVQENPTLANDTSAADESATMSEMRRLCQFIYQGDQQRERTRAILYHTYFLALHDQWFKARDLMLMSNLQQNIEHSDIATQILYNRAMVQLGLCAFRKGQLRDAHVALVDIQSSGRAKELLAQGVTPARFERTPEQEKLEKRRQMPYHMHINLELLECVYLVSAMLLEIPSIAAHENDQRRRMISKNFHHVLKISERNTVNGPPESMREHIVAAAKAMRQGKWRDTMANIINDKMNAKVWNLFFQSEKVKSMLETKIKEESLRTYLFTFASIFDTLSMKRLSEQFELDMSQVHSIVSRMILHDEISASLDEPTRCIVMHKTEPSRLQQLALQLTERLSSLVDINEKIAEAKNISIVSAGPRQFAGQQQQNRGGYSDRRQGRYHGGQGGGQHRGERAY